MRYGESIFDICYLTFAIVAGIILLTKAKSKVQRAMGIASLVLGVGDAFHLVPRVLNYFLSADFTVALGVGKMITSITMTVFYLFLFDIWIREYRQKYSVSLSIVVTVLAATRIILCLFPQNGWLTNTTSLSWSLARNVPFILLGAIICVLYFQKRKEQKTLSRVWLYIMLSFLFYLPVAFAADVLPMLGMLMLPKTICYILLIVSFLRYQRAEENAAVEQ